MTNKSQIKLRNRERLANYLESGNLAFGFDMVLYYEPGDDYELSECGCALGHARHLFNAITEDFRGLAYDLFIERNLRDFEWLFDAGWAFVDNTPEGAAKRIRYFNKFGVPDYTSPQYYQENPGKYQELLSTV